MLLTFVFDVLRVVELALRLRDRRGGAGRRDDAGPRERDRGWGQAITAELTRLAPCIGAARTPEVIVTRAVANAAASGGRIYLNPEWMESAAQQLCARDDGCRRDLVRGLAAHELSHHVRAPGRAGRGAHGEELTADAWAGYLLARTGASLQPYMTLVGSGPAAGSVTHPPPNLRVVAAAAGARIGEAERAEDCCDACRPRHA